jgi:hypothetical protein
MLKGLSAQQLVTLLVECAITPKQLLLLWFLYLDKEEGKGKLIQDGPAIANVYRFAESVETWSFLEIDDLVRKGWMVDRNKKASDGGRQAYPDYFEVSEAFIDKVFVTGDKFEQFWEEYPSFVENFDGPRGPKIPLKASIMEEVEILYNKRVRTKAKHRQVMEILSWAKSNNLINMNIAKYVGSGMFDQHMELRNSGGSVVLEHRTI